LIFDYLHTSLLLTKDIQQSICKVEIQKGNLVAENFNYFFAGELDVVSVNKSGYVSEFEVKISRPDFRADAKKRKWYFYENYQALLNPNPYSPNYFTYVCPTGLIQETDIKPYQGLIWFSEGELTIIRKPKLIHKHKHDIQKLLTKMLTVNNWKSYFGAQRLTIQIREAAALYDEGKQQQLAESLKHLPKPTKTRFKACNANERCECRLNSFNANNI